MEHSVQQLYEVDKYDEMVEYLKQENEEWLKSDKCNITQKYDNKSRDRNFESNIKGLFPCGEGAGYAGGIISSAVDGLKVCLQETDTKKAGVK